MDHGGKFWENSARSEMTRMTEFTGENGTFTFGACSQCTKKIKKQRIRGLEPWLKFLAMPALWVQIPKIWATEAEEFWGFAAPRVDSHRSGGWDFESLSWKLAENWDMSWIVMDYHRWSSYFPPKNTHPQLYRVFPGIAHFQTQRLFGFPASRWIWGQLTGSASQ